MLSIATILLILTSCEKQELLESNSIEISQNPNWSTEDFKNNYIIQFPDNYEGYGMVGFEGNIFFKNRNDYNVEFNYYFCGLSYCNDFGNALAIPIPKSIMVVDKNNNEINLNSKTEFSFNDEIVGILYFNTELNSTGIYYMKQGTEYLEGLSINFANSEYQELENIVKSIVEK